MVLIRDGILISGVDGPAAVDAWGKYLLTIGRYTILAMVLILINYCLLMAWALRQLVTMDLDHVVTGIATNPTAALRLAQQTTSDLALVDISLENNTSGITAARDLWLSCRVPSIFVTAYRNDAEPVDGAIGCLLKPYGLVDIRLMLDAAEAVLSGEEPDAKKLPPQFIYYGSPRDRDPEVHGHDSITESDRVA